MGPDSEKVMGFLQYAGLLMPAGDVMRGVKGTFTIYDVHLGDLIAENTIVGRRTKSIPQFLEVMRATKHQAWPRLFCLDSPKQRGFRPTPSLSLYRNAMFAELKEAVLMLVSVPIAALN